MCLLDLGFLTHIRDISATISFKNSVSSSLHYTFGIPIV